MLAGMPEERFQRLNSFGSNYFRKGHFTTSSDSTCFNTPMHIDIAAFPDQYELLFQFCSDKNVSTTTQILQTKLKIPQFCRNHLQGCLYCVCTCLWIINHDVGTFPHQAVAYINGRRLSCVSSVLFESESKNGDFLSGNGVKHARHNNFYKSGEQNP